MPTLPPEPSRLSDLESHQYRQVAESFGADAERYDRARPRYPDALVTRLLAVAPGKDVVDVGCGTGIVARQFQAAGCRVLGVDPDSRMADQARRLGVVVEPGRFEEWDPARRRFDAVVAGQAWHWVDPVVGAGKAAEALRPGGRLAVFWNAGDPAGELGAAFSAVYRRVVPDSPFFQSVSVSAVDAYRRMTGKAAEGMRQTGEFTGLEHWRFDWSWEYSRNAWLDQLPTQGPMTRLAPESMAEIARGVGAIIDEAGGAFTMQYTTLVVTAARL